MIDESSFMILVYEDEDRSSYTTPIVRNMYVGRFAYFKRNKLRIKCK